MDCGVPFCQAGMNICGMTSGCPLHNLVPEWNDLVSVSYTHLKVLNTNDGRISLSIKAAEENAQAEEIEDTDAKQYSSGESLGTSLGDLFAKLKL